MTIKREFGGTGYCLRGDPQRQPLLVLIHGVGMNQSMWRGAAQLLARDLESHSLLSYDFLGHGDSHNPSGERTMADYVAQLEALLAHLKVSRFALAGFSMGALIAQAFASLQPHRLTHLALLHSVYQRTEAQCEGVRMRCRASAEHGAAAVVEAALERWFSAEYRRCHADVMEGIREIFANHAGDGYLKAYHLFAHAEAEMANYPVTGVTCPALVLTGADDVGSLPAMSRALCRDLPNARLIINRGHLHMAPMEHAEVVTAQLISLLQDDG